MITRHTLCAFAFAAATPAFAATITQTNLTSDGAVTAAVTDPNLKNPWGISYGPGGAFWVSDNDTGLTTLYNGAGAIQSLVVTIPPPAGATGPSAPTGQVYNGSTGFKVTASGKSGASTFIFDTEDGTISGWAPSVSFSTAILAVDNSKSKAVYKGLALYTPATGTPVLMATNFFSGMIEVYDNTFKLKTSFRDTTLPAKYAPYNVQVLGSAIYVTYAVVDAARHDSISGPGLGVVEQIDITGKVLASYQHGFLNAPWGLAIAPAKFGKWSNDLLVGNFGDGHVTALTKALKPVGQLKTAAGKKLAIDGLWALIIGNGGMGGSTSDIYFTAGTNNEADGLLGSLSLAP